MKTKQEKMQEEEVHKFFCNCGYSCRTKGMYLAHKHGTSMYHFPVTPGEQVPEHLQFRETRKQRKRYKEIKNQKSKK